jgi:diguanylate cyclase (GGDEF)-like protein/PAS domain S-box-containing protein
VAAEGPALLPTTWAQLELGKTVAVTDVAAAGPDWLTDRSSLAARSIRAAARAPIVCGGVTVGLLGVDMAGEIRRWTDDELWVLRLLGGVIGSAIARSRAEDELTRQDHLFRALVERSSDVVVIVEPDGAARFISPSVERLVGYKPDELLGTVFLTLLHPEDLERVMTRFIEVTAGDPGGDPMVMRVQHADGSWRWVEGVGSNLLDDPAIGAILVNLREVTEQVAAERAVRAHQDRFQLLVDSLPDVVVRLDEHLHPIYGNDAATELRRRWEQAGHVADRHGRHDTLDATYHKLQGVLSSGRPQSFQMMLNLDDGEHWFEVTGIPELTDDGTANGVITVSRDITSFKAREDELTRQTLEDPLTGLANRTRFEAELDRSLQGLGRNEGPVGILFLDLDGFKSINDEHGHGIGDRFLAEFAHNLRESVRPADLVARVGGDEFVVLPDRLRIMAELTELAERLHTRLCAPVSIESHRLSVSVSIGVAAVTRPGQVTALELLDRADRAMYRAKRRGPGHTSVWTR